MNLIKKSLTTRFGKSKREVARYYGYNDRKMVKGLLERERRKERKLEVGILDL